MLVSFPLAFIGLLHSGYQSHATLRAKKSRPKCGFGACQTNRCAHIGYFTDKFCVYCVYCTDCVFLQILVYYIGLRCAQQASFMAFVVTKLLEI